MSVLPDVQSTKVATSFGEIEYLERGEGEAVLVVHGSPGGCDQGLLLGDFLVDAGFRVVIPSRPGYCQTPLTTQNSSIDAQADAHAALMTELGIDRFAVLCWSGGGPSSYRLAVRHPQRVSAIVAVAALSGAHVWNESLDERFFMHTRLGYVMLAALARWAPKQSISATLAAEGKLSKPELKELTAAVAADPKKSSFVAALSLMASQTPPRKIGIGNDKQNYAAIVDLELDAVTAPVLLFHGDADLDVDPTNSDRAAATLANAKLEVMSKGGHISFWIAPDSDAMQERTVQFLRSHH